MSTIAEKIRSLISNPRDARRVNTAARALGVLDSSLDLYLNGQRHPSDEQLARLATAFGLDTSFFHEDRSHNRQISRVELAAFKRRVPVACDRAGIDRNKAVAWLAEQINYPNVVISAFLYGGESPSITTVEKIAAALKVNSSWLIGEGAESENSVGVPPSDEIVGDAAESGKRHA